MDLAQLAGLKLLKAEHGVLEAESIRRAIAAYLPDKGVKTPQKTMTRPLPLNQPVEIEFTPDKPGDIALACGMGMFNGTVVVTGN